MNNTKMAILKEAYELFAENGYSTSLDEVAKKVGIKTPSLYAHFENKEELFFILIKQEIESYFSKLDLQFRNLHGKNTYTQISGIFFSVMEYFKHDNRARFWRNIPLIKVAKLRDQCRLLIKQNDRKYSELMAAILHQGVIHKELRESVDDGSVNLLLAMIQGILDGMLLYENDEFDIQLFALKAWQAFWDGIKY